MGARGCRPAWRKSSARRPPFSGVSTTSAKTSSRTSPRASRRCGAASSRGRTRSRPTRRRKPHSRSSGRTSGGSTSPHCAVWTRGRRRRSPCTGSGWGRPSGRRWRRRTCWSRCSAGSRCGRGKWIGGAPATRSTGGWRRRCCRNAVALAEREDELIVQIDHAGLPPAGGTPFRSSSRLAPSAMCPWPRAAPVAAGLP